MGQVGWHCRGQKLPYYSGRLTLLYSLGTQYGSLEDTPLYTNHFLCNTKLQVCAEKILLSFLDTSNAKGKVTFINVYHCNMHTSRVFYFLCMIYSIYLQTGR